MAAKLLVWKASPNAPAGFTPAASPAPTAAIWRAVELPLKLLSDSAPVRPIGLVFGVLVNPPARPLVGNAAQFTPD